MSETIKKKRNKKKNLYIQLKWISINDRNQKIIYSTKNRKNVFIYSKKKILEILKIHSSFI